MTFTTDPVLFAEGSRWTFTHPRTGETRHYAIEKILPAAGEGAAMYGLRRTDIAGGGLAWATHGSLQGVVQSNPGWSPAATEARVAA